MRISTSQIYSSTLSQINGALSDYMKINEMNSSQKRINTISDDPYGAARVTELRARDDCLSGYVDNCARATELLGSADSSLTSISEMITSALETCEQAATETYTDEQLSAMAVEIRQYMESIYGVSNTKLGENAIFAGNDIENDAYDIAMGVTIADPALTSADIVAVTGEADGTVWLQFDTTGTVGTAATTDLDYRYSTDNGETWTTGTLAAGDTVVTCGDCSIELADGTVPTVADGEGEGASLLLRETYAYTGASRALDLTVTENSDMDVTLVGSSVFGGVSADGTAYEDSNLFETLADAAVYMDIGDHEAVAECLEKLTTCQEQVTTIASEVGAAEVRASYTSSSLAKIQEQLDNSVSNEEDADATQLTVELSQAEYIYQAVLQSTADIIQMSLLNYI